MKKGSMLVVILGIIVLIFLLSILIIVFVNQNLNNYKIKQQEILAIDVARSAGYAMLDQLLEDETIIENINDGQRINLNLSNFSGELYAIIDKGYRSSVNITAVVGNVQKTFKLYIVRDFLSFALTITGDVIIDSKGKGGGTGITVFGDVLTTPELYDKVVQLLSNKSTGEIYKAPLEDIVFPAVTLPPDEQFSEMGDLTIPQGTSYTIYSEDSTITLLSFDTITIGKNAELIIDTSKSDVLIKVATMVLGDPGVKDNEQPEIIATGGNKAMIYFENSNSIDPTKNNLVVNAEGETDFLLFSEEEITLEIKNNGNLENVYFFAPNGHIIAKNNLTLKGSLILKTLTVKNGTEIYFIPISSSFPVFEGQDPSAKYKKYALIGWSP
ncbi:MAG: hypothetical protein H0Z24_09870 [Thermosipho sp. (in: Bacteria)]|nr:hypothetical protein [Thermosipho sp. (in: thermotogales)]